MNTLFKTVTNSLEQDQVVSLSSAGNYEHQIFITDLVLEMFIGVLDEETKSQQRVIVNAEITVSNTAKADDISTVVSYADIINQIKSIANQGHIKLVETFAEKIIDNCFADNRIQAITLSVEKPDITKEAGSVGVRVSRSRY